MAHFIAFGSPLRTAEQNYTVDEKTPKGNTTQDQNSTRTSPPSFANVFLQSRNSGLFVCLLGFCDARGISNLSAVQTIAQSCLKNSLLVFEPSYKAFYKRDFIAITFHEDSTCCYRGEYLLRQQALANVRKQYLESQNNLGQGEDQPLTETQKSARRLLSPSLSYVQSQAYGRASINIWRHQASASPIHTEADWFLSTAKANASGAQHRAHRAWYTEELLRLEWPYERCRELLDPSLSLTGDPYLSHLTGNQFLEMALDNTDVGLPGLKAHVSSLLILLGALKAHAGKDELAIPYFTRAMQIDPKNPDAHELLSAGSEDNDDLAKAIFHMKEALQWNNSPENRSRLEELEKQYALLNADDSEDSDGDTVMG